MKRKTSFFLIVSLQIMSCVAATTRPFTPASAALQQEQIPEPPKQGVGSMGRRENGDGEEAYRGLSTLGSRPPNCKRKCEGCIPCNAVQIPTTTDQIRVQYSNYEPEGWKCKCGSSFFNP